ncbi:MAG: 23S rRNA (pseudouridine(1915)-N(3))-methyltransferase RlmH [Hyphomicrobiales bacterium]
MHISIFAIGRLKRAPEEDLVRDYTSRLTKHGRHVGISGASVREFAESNASTAEQRKSQEAKTLIASLPDKAKLIALDERGDNLTSQKFAGLVQNSLDNADRDLVFVIGGPDGLDDSIIRMASAKLSFGKLTWPHRLVRVMLSEQIYRAVTILVNHPYHRE